MARLCERPSCSAPAAAAYGFDTEQLIVTLDPLDLRQQALQGVLCAHHADHLRAPRGWVVLDRRDDEPRLFRVPPAETTPDASIPVAEPPRPTAGAETDAGSPTDEPPRPRRRPAKPLPDTTEELALFESIEPAERPDRDDRPDVGVREPEIPDATSSQPWNPAFDRRNDLDGQLAARSPLLARAFGVLDEHELPS